jgi:phosphate transport system protein
MSHYEQRLERDLNDIHDRVAAVGERVEQALRNAIHALLTGDEALAYRTDLEDRPINRAVREIDRRCHAFIALHLPGGGHLRLISAVIRANIELERIGDYAVNICRQVVRLSSPPQGALARELELMTDEAQRVLHQAIMAFNERNADAARATIAMADQVERSCDTILEGLDQEGDSRELRDLFALFVVFGLLERVAGQAKNLCEGAIFAATGEPKAPKVYRILFLDRDNACLGPMTEAIARKHFPESGEYASAGPEPASELNPDMVAFMRDHGVDLGGRRPQRLELVRQELAKKHVIVSLQDAVRSYVPEVPEHTVALQWEVGEYPSGPDATQTRERFEVLYREIAMQVRDLMVLLRGEDAS